MNSPIIESKKRKYTFFGAALFLRPKLKEHRPLALSYNIEKIVETARKNPEDWECLLMKRNYLDFAWDHIGGHNEFHEFPAQTMQREVQEEVGWKTREYREICRQWKDGFLNGFIYLVIPSEPYYMENEPPRVPCDEVQKVEYFGLLQILESDMFKENVKGRIQAFIKGDSDFSL